MDLEGLGRSEFTRRKFMLLAAGATGAALLAACGGDDDDDDAGGSGSGATATTAGGSGATAPSGSSATATTGSGSGATAAGTSTGDAAGEPKTGGILKYGIGNDPPTMDPHTFSGAASDMLYGLVYNGLVRYGPTWDIEAALAESWDTEEDRIYTFKLREGLKFHDGSDLTADDVKFSFDRIMDEATSAYIRPLIMSSFESVEVVDPLTVKITLSEVNAAFLAALALPTAAIVSKAFVEGGGDLKTTMMGAGPFKYISRQPNVEVVLEKHTEYYEEGKPYLDGVTLVPLSDDTARSTGLRSGSVDFIDFVPWKDIEAIAEDPGFEVYSDTESSGLWAFMKTNIEPMDDKIVRQALNYAVNREAVVNSSFFGRGAVMDSIFIPKSSWAYVDVEGGYSYDPDRAKELLAEAGAEGFPLQFVCSAETTMHLSGAEVVLANFQDIGIDVDFQTQDWATTVKRQNAGDYEMIMWGGGPLYGDPDYLSGYFRTGNAVPRNTGYSNPELDDLLDQARQTLDPDARLETYRKIYDILLDESPWIPLSYREQGEAAATHVKGYVHVLGSNWNGYRVAMTWLDK